MASHVTTVRTESAATCRNSIQFSLIFGEKFFLLFSLIKLLRKFFNKTLEFAVVPPHTHPNTDAALLHYMTSSACVLQIY